MVELRPSCECCPRVLTPGSTAPTHRNIIDHEARHWFA